VEKVFRERQIEAKPYRSVAVQVLGRRDAVTSTME